jgi:hypothetical protein
MSSMSIQLQGGNEEHLGQQLEFQVVTVNDRGKITECGPTRPVV